MRRSIKIAFRAGIGQLVVVAMTFFVESLFPLGDWRWLAIAVGGIVVLAAWVYVEHRIDRKKRDDAKLADRVRDLLGILSNTEIKVTNIRLRRIESALGIDDEEST